MKLRDLYPKLSGDERQALAEAVGIKPSYLWQIATGWSPSSGKQKGRIKRASIELITKLAQADARLHITDMVAEFRRPEKETA
jgi:hypothetical protein